MLRYRREGGEIMNRIIVKTSGFILMIVAGFVAKKKRFIITGYRYD